MYKILTDRGEYSLNFTFKKKNKSSEELQQIDEEKPKQTPGESFEPEINQQEKNDTKSALQPVEKKVLHGRAQKIGINLLLLVGIGMILYAYLSSRPPRINTSVPPVEPVSVPTVSQSSQQGEESLPTDRLYITAERAAYQDGQLVLRIPRMGVDAAIQNGTTDEDMDRGPGLYDYAQLPGEGNRNVSIVAHRDIAGSLFYYIDRLGEGDLFYLIYNGKIYVYNYKETKVVEPDDWSPIYPQGFSCLTLTSCHPLGTTRQRIIVTAELVRIDEYQKYYNYLPWEEGYDKQYTWESGAKPWTEQEKEESSKAGSQSSSSEPASPGVLPG